MAVDDLRSPSDAVRVRRGVGRASYDEALVHEILDAGLVAHVGTVRDGQPVVIPMFCVREGDALLLHGAPASGVIRRGVGTTVCVTMTILDGLVLARSAFHHSVNYRSVTVIGEATEVTDPVEKETALEAFIDHAVPGRQAMLRPTNEKERRATSVLRVPLAQASVKVRAGGPGDDEADEGLPIWAGVVPLHQQWGAAQSDPSAAAVEVPDRVAAMEGQRI